MLDIVTLYFTQDGIHPFILHPLEAIHSANSSYLFKHAMHRIDPEEFLKILQNISGCYGNQEITRVFSHVFFKSTKGQVG
jgi:hypothetical protein